MPRYPSRHASSAFSFGPGPLSTALKAIIGINVAIFVAQYFLHAIPTYFGLTPVFVVRYRFIWQVVTYMFVHAGPMHIIFNMLTLWMFGTELERIWGTRFFLRFYFVCGIGAGLITVLLAAVSQSALPATPTAALYEQTIVGASGAIYGLLLAYALYFPNRLIYMYFVFPIPAKLFVLIMGGLAFLSSMSDNGGGVANATHLGGLLVAYLYLKSPRLRLSPWAEVRYRYAKWRIGRARKKFDVYSGGRSNGSDQSDRWDRRVH